MRSAGSGARPFGGGVVVFSLAKGPVKPETERQDEFPPRSDGGSECRTPAHRSRDGERCAGAGLGPGRADGSSTPLPSRSFPAPTRELPTRRCSPGRGDTRAGGPGSRTDPAPPSFPLTCRPASVAAESRL